MTFRQFAFNNVFRNKRLYIAYFLSSLFTVMVFFTFANFAFHPLLSGENMRESVLVGMMVAGGIIYVFSFFFILYSMSAFLQSRKKEFGVLMVQGMSSGQIRWMVFLENIIIGFLSTVFGIGIGLLFSKVILLIAENLLVIEDKLSFYFPTMAIIITFISFIILFLIISFFVTFILRTNKLIKLIKGDKIGKAEPKASIILTVFAVLLLASGYLIAFVVKGNAVVMALFPVALLVIIGTYFLFTQLSVFIIDRLKKNKQLFWKNTNMLLFSNLSYRMKDNARAFFLVAIISTVAFSAIGTLVGFKSYLMKDITNSEQFSFTYFIDKNKIDEKELAANIASIEETFEENNLEVGTVDVDLQYFQQGEHDTSVLIMNVDDFNEFAHLLGKRKIKLKGEEIIQVEAVEVLNMGKQLYEDSLILRSDLPAITLRDGTEVNVTKRIPNEGIVPETVNHYIVSNDVYYQLDDPIKLERPLKWHVTKGDRMDIVKAGKVLTERFDGNFFAIDLVKYTIELVFGSILFVGLFIGMIFFVSAGSFLYFRLYADLDEDKTKFNSISKIGLTTSELKKVISRQTAILFFAPIIVAIIHGAVALTALSHMFEYDLKIESTLVLGSFLLIQIIYYLVVRHFYTKQIVRATT